MTTNSLLKAKLLFSILLVTICGLSSSQAQAQNFETMWCPFPRIAGFDAPYNRATRRLSPPVSSVERMEAFVTTRGDYLYIHSNYRPVGADFPFKLATRENILNLRELIEYLADPQTAQLPRTDISRRMLNERMLFAYLSRMKIIVEEQVLSHPRYRDLDFGNVANLVLVGSDGVARPTRVIGSSGDNSRRVVELRANRIYADMKKPDAIRIMQRFNSKPFRRDDVRVLSLIQDQATISKVEGLIPSRNRIAFDFSSVDALNREFSAQPGKTVFVIGHIPEGSGRLVVENAAQQEVFSIPIQQLETMARTNSSSVIILGCRSAATAEAGGVINELNSLVAVDRLGAAMNARNYGEFAERLAAPDLIFVADEALLQGANRRVITLTYRDVLERGLGPALVAGSLIIIAETLDSDDSRRRRRPRRNGGTRNDR